MSRQRRAAREPSRSAAGRVPPWAGAEHARQRAGKALGATNGAGQGVRFSVQRYSGKQDALGGPVRIIYDSANYSIAACRNGETVLILGVERSRVKSAGFSFILDPAALRRGVADLLKTGNGIERWLAPGLEHTQMCLTRYGNNPALLKAIPRVLRSLEGVPRAVPPRLTTPSEGTRLTTPRRARKVGTKARKVGTKARKPGNRQAD